jgi:hypothetical protein
MSKFSKNEKVRVSESAPFHAGRIGYFQFDGQGDSKSVTVLSVQPIQKNNTFIQFEFFAVDDKFIEKF